MVVQLSASVHALPSSQVPLVTKLQPLVDTVGAHWLHGWPGLAAPAARQVASMTQNPGLSTGAHAPAWHTPLLHSAKLLSLHTCPSAVWLWTQPLSVHVSTVHGLWSSHTDSAVHDPASQCPETVHFPSPWPVQVASSGSCSGIQTPLEQRPSVHASSNCAHSLSIWHLIRLSAGEPTSPAVSATLASAMGTHSPAKHAPEGQSESLMHAVVGAMGLQPHSHTVASSASLPSLEHRRLG